MSPRTTAAEAGLRTVIRRLEALIPTFVSTTTPPRACTTFSPCAETRSVIRSAPGRGIRTSGHPQGIRYAAAEPVSIVGESGTADSFSDGNRFLTPAVAHAQRLRSEGADIIELGPAASHPGAQRVRTDEEMRRLDGVIDQLVGEGVHPSRRTTRRRPRPAYVRALSGGEPQPMTQPVGAHS
ncbi:dihydropteroate synthase [Streptomyces sp. NBC_00285]|uniref:dihydropteroate synthase n=1 Tax=Streptomyces sp. NBC_00285 TaxID=2975700 RepID=UPI002E2E6214|nr:dihydropteroate synthase [Streptomyces sp. NBC_00285]